MKEFFKYNGRKVSYSDQGRGDAVVLLHGYLETSEVWSSFATKLSDKFRVIAVDLPGHGDSDMFNETHPMEFMAEMINDLTGSLNIERFFLVGHSLGGYVALAFAEMFPGKLSGYCLFHSQPFPDTPEVIEKREREINLVKAGKKDLLYPENISRMFAVSNLKFFSGDLQRLRNIASSIPGKAIIAVLKGMMARPSRLSVMVRGKIPFLWILGAMDNYINCEQIQAKVHLPANAMVVILKNSGHLGFIEEERRSLEVIESFIKGNQLKKVADSSRH